MIIHDNLDDNSEEFTVLVKEVFSVIINAKSQEDAVKKVQELYQDNKLEFCVNDLEYTEFK